jgi:hypothetical protein
MWSLMPKGHYQGRFAMATTPAESPQTTADLNRIHQMAQNNDTSGLQKFLEGERTSSNPQAHAQFERDMIALRQEQHTLGRSSQRGSEAQRAIDAELTQLGFPPGSDLVGKDKKGFEVHTPDDPNKPNGAYHFEHLNDQGQRVRPDGSIAPAPYKPGPGEPPTVDNPAQPAAAGDPLTPGGHLASAVGDLAWTPVEAVEQGIKQGLRPIESAVNHITEGIHNGDGWEVAEGVGETAAAPFTTAAMTGYGLVKGAATSLWTVAKDIGGAFEAGWNE